MRRDQGGHYFLSLHTGKRLNRHSCKELPMPNEVIAQIHQLSTTEENYDGIVFTDLAGKQLSEQFENEDTDDIRSNTAKD